MEVTEIFPTLFGKDNNIDLAIEMLPLATAYLKYAEKINFKNNPPGIKPLSLKEKWGYKTTYDSSYPKDFKHLQTLERSRPVRDYILKISKEFLIKYGYNEEKCSRLFISNFFVSEMIYGETHTSHRHPNSILSGVFYLQVPDGASPILIEDPRPHYWFLGEDSNISQDNKYNTSVLRLQPKAGDIFIWNSWLPHSVPISNQAFDGSRITMVFNVNVNNS
jgi:hypothetical protein